MENKLKIGIDINEVLRARWLQFDRFYAQEFGEEGIPEEPYVYDFFKYYKWEDTVESNKVLKEPEDMPEDINPLDYQHDEKLGEVPADAFLFKKSEEKHLTAKEVYNRFMYEDFVFEIHGSVPQMYRGLDNHLSKFCLDNMENAEIVIVSRENYLSIPSTLFFLSVLRPKVKKYILNDDVNKIWNEVDIIITADPELLTNIPNNKSVIKVKRPFNEKISCDFEILQINDLNPIDEKNENVDVKFNKFKDFKKIINHIKPE
jgi:hypothetical protein